MDTIAAKVTEITECVKEEKAGRVLDATATHIRILFHTVADAASWVSNYASEDGAHFENNPPTFANPAVVVLDLATYDL